MKFKYNYLFFMLLGCLPFSHMVAAQEKQTVFNYIYSFFYAENAQHKNRILSFDERLALLEEQFKDVPKGADFNEKIMALQMKGYTYQACLEISALTQKFAAEQSGVVELDHFDAAYFFHEYKKYPDPISSYQFDDFKLDAAYHEGAHAVVTMMQDVDSETALYSVSIKPYKNSGGRFRTISLSAESIGDDIYLMKLALDRYMAGGVGEIIFKVPCQHRTVDYFDKIDKNHELYDYADFITRYSTQGDIDIVCNIADVMLQVMHGDDNYQATADERTQLVQESLKRVKMQVIEHKDKIEKLVHRLVEKETIYADEAYEICGKQRPKFYFEK